jgi:hypothetical protein
MVLADESNMFDALEHINERPRPFEFYTADTLWADDYISERMLAYHLDPDGWFLVTGSVLRVPERIQVS